MEARFWHQVADGRIQCDLCPRHCRLGDGQRGLCYVRRRQGDRIFLTTYGRAMGLCMDPIEKKPLNHFLPGTPVLSFGTAGCNLACKFCQNWHMSKSQQTDDSTEAHGPELIAAAAKQLGSRSVAFTYNDPVIFHEFAVDTARACRALGIKTVAVTNGYMDPEPRAEFYAWMDAANVDLKAFTDSFYRRLCGGRLQPVLETLEYLKRETQVWLEITTLLIPGENDSSAEMDALTRWVVQRLGPEVPIHFSAFHPDWKMTDKPRTPTASLVMARKIALANGVRYPFTGNVQDREGGGSSCHGCGRLLIDRDGWVLRGWHLTPQGACRWCGAVCAGVFEPTPGTWGAKRVPVRIRP